MNNDILNGQFIEELDKTFKEALEIVKRKNQDYATKTNPFRNFEYAAYWNIDVAEAIGVRISDKFARIANLYQKSKNGERRAVMDERMEDTILDCINYLAILKLWLESQNTTGLQED